MGIYVFRRRALDEALSNTANVDFGRHVIPAAVPRLRVQAHVHDGYWEDVGHHRLLLRGQPGAHRSAPEFSFYDPSRPIYTHPRFLPATKVASCEVTDSLLSEGCYIESARIERSVIGIRSRIARGARIRRSLLLGADWYESVEDIERALRDGTPAMGVGEETVIENAIVDKNARVGRGVRIVNEKKERERDGGHYHIRDGIVVIPKGAIIPDGTVI
jgi:glucose-1-phosphate adenylyltransferase